MFRLTPWSHGIWFSTDKNYTEITRNWALLSLSLSGIERKWKQGKVSFKLHPLRGLRFVPLSLSSFVLEPLLVENNPPVSSFQWQTNASANDLWLSHEGLLCRVGSVNLQVLSRTFFLYPGKDSLQEVLVPLCAQFCLLTCTIHKREYLVLISSLTLITNDARAVKIYLEQSKILKSRWLTKIHFNRSLQPWQLEEINTELTSWYTIIWRTQRSSTISNTCRYIWYIVNILLMKSIIHQLSQAHTFSNCDTCTDIRPAFLLH